MRRYEACLKKCAEEVLDRRIAQGVAQARAADRADFAATLLDSLPLGPLHGQVWCDLDLLQIDELLLLSGLDTQGWSQTQLRQLAQADLAAQSLEKPA